MNTVLDELQRVLTPLALAAFTAFVAYGFKVLRDWLGIQRSEADEEAIRRAAATEAGKLIVAQTTDLMAVDASVAKIIADLPKQVKSEGYTPLDLADMIVSNFVPFGNIASAVVKGALKQ